MSLRPPSLRSPPGWADHARSLAVLAIAYNVLESLVSMAFGWADGSIALFGCGCH